MPTTYAIPDGRVAMAATLYTGTGANASIVNTVNGVSFQPDFVWIKDRSVGYNHVLQDSVRGATAAAKLSSNLTDAEGSANLAPYGNVSAFNSNGFSLVAGSVDSRQTNASGDAYIGWQWKAGGTAVSNTAGSIASSVSANTTAGFSVVTYTGNDTTGATVGHGLGVAPSMIIVKERSQVRDWSVYHISTGNTGGLRLNGTGANETTRTGWWNNTTPSSTVITLGGSTGNDWYQTNQTGNTYVAYCFAPVAGYSAFGKYTGNGSADGPFVYTGFRPRWIMLKRTDTTSDWTIWDTARDVANASVNRLFPNLSTAETVGVNFDITSNGFKLRDSGAAVNASGGTYIYYAVAENPFAYSNAR